MSRVRHAGGPIAGLVLAVLLFVHARSLDEWSGPERLGPSFWPQAVLAGLAVACVLRLVAEWRRRPRVAPSVDASRPLPRARLAAALGLLLLYVAAAPGAGFPLATAG